MASEHALLLDDVLAEAAPQGFAQDLLGETLALAGRRRRWRALKRSATMAGATLAAIAVVFGAVFYRIRGRIAIVATAPSCPVVHTLALTDAEIVRTHALAPQMLVATTATVEVVHTTSISGRYRRLNDAELLAMLVRHPAALIRDSRRTEKLVFVNATDATGFRLN